MDCLCRGIQQTRHCRTYAHPRNCIHRHRRRIGACGGSCKLPVINSALCLRACFLHNRIDMDRCRNDSGSLPAEIADADGFLLLCIPRPRHASSKRIREHRPERSPHCILRAQMRSIGAVAHPGLRIPQPYGSRAASRPDDSPAQIVHRRIKPRLPLLFHLRVPLGVHARTRRRRRSAAQPLIAHAAWIPCSSRASARRQKADLRRLRV